MATSFLKFFSIGSEGVAFIVGASLVGCGAGGGRIYTWSVEGATGSGHLVSWAVAVGVGFNSVGIG